MPGLHYKVGDAEDGARKENSPPCQPLDYQRLGSPLSHAACQPHKTQGFLLLFKSFSFLATHLTWHMTSTTAVVLPVPGGP